jgi:hypothetical protein
VLPQTEDQKLNSTKPEAPHVYKRALVTLIDILGFSNLITTATAEEIYIALRQIDHITGPTLLWHSFAKQYNYVFSDLIVTAQFFRQRVKRAEVELSFFASAAKHLRLIGDQQFRLTCGGIFVRGGITLGDIYADRSTIFGPALVRAYQLESQVARWPIVIFDEQLITEFEERAKRFDDNDFLGLFNTFINRTENGIFFLDYLSVMAYEDTTTGDLDYKLDDHRSAIITAFEQHKNERYREKYHFLSTYHDRKCDQYSLPRLKIGVLR